MGIVFAVLALLALSIKVLSLMDREPVPAAEGAGPATASPPPSASTGEITGQQVAAIAVALALSEQQTRAVPPRSGQISAGPSTGSWLQSGRMRSLGLGPHTGGRRGQ